MASRVKDTFKGPSQTDRVLLALRRMLLTGQFSSGERLTELGLVARLGASRTPVRHALSRLAHEGLLEALPKGGFRVCAFTLEEVWDAIDLRGVLEGSAARLAAERLVGEGELARLREIQHEIDTQRPEGASNFTGFLELNDAFHQELLRLSKSPMLIRTVASVVRLPFAGPSTLIFEGNSREAVRTADLAQAHHHAIIEALSERAGARAEHLAREHARLARVNLSRALANPAIFARMPGAALLQLGA
jgi:GntR family transcriptional regulator of vanillate catabolism